MKFTVITSLCFSILAVLLFWGQKLGINVVIFVLPFVCVTIYLLQKRRKVKNPKGYFLVIPIVLLAITYGIYQNRLFQITNLLAMVLLYNTMLIWTMSQKYQLEFILRRIGNLVLKPFQFIKKSCKGIGLVFRTKKEKQVQTEKQLEEGKKSRLIKQIFIGIGISIPVIAIVVVLLCSADYAFFETIKGIVKFFMQYMGNILDAKFGFSIFMRFLVIIILTIYLVGFFINLFSRKPWKRKTEKGISICIETTILNTVLTMLNLIYIVFCKMQISSLLQAAFSQEGFYYANYAREGFFQLMAVSIINFTMILLTTKNTKQSSKIQIYYRKAMNFILAVSTMVILLSAFVRMNLYGEAYGYTVLRILVYFVLITEAILMIPTILYLFCEKFSPWKSYFIIITVMYVVMNFSNIPQIIARKNIERYLEGGHQKIDVVYLKKTKTDGLEEVLNLYQNTNDPFIKHQLKSYFNDLESELEQEDHFLEWNYSKQRARELLKSVE